MKNKLILFFSSIVLASCAGIVFEPEKVEDFFSWGDTEQDQIPDDAIMYECKAKNRFFIKYLDDKKTIWIVFPEREFKLYQDEVNPAIYTNSLTTLELSNENTLVKDQKGIVYENCFVKLND
jgi:hypothetical protein